MGSDLLPVGLYARKSAYRATTDDPNDIGRSCQRQIDQGKAYIATQPGWFLHAVYVDDNVSASAGATRRRSDYERMRADIAAGHLRIAATWESSRLHRTVDTYVELRSLCVQHGVLWCYRGQLFDLTKRHDRFRTGLDALLAEDEVLALQERVRDEMVQARLRGRPHGRPKYGYRRIYNERRELVEVVPVPDQAAVIREIAARYAAGEPQSLIAASLTERAIPAPSGKPTWTQLMVRRIATDLVYMGWRTHRGEIVHTALEGGRAMWPALIDDDIHRACVARVNNPELARHRPRGRVKYLLSGIITCSVCGAELRATTGRLSGRHYVCPSRGGEGGHLSRLRDPVDRYVVARVLARVHNVGVVDLLLGDDRAAAELRGVLADLEARRGQLNELYDRGASGELDTDDLVQMVGRVRPIVRELERRAARLQAAPAHGALFAGAGPGLPGLWRWWQEGLTLAQQRVVVRLLTQRIVLSPVGKGARGWPLRESLRIEWGRQSGADQRPGES